MRPSVSRSEAWDLGESEVDFNPAILAAAPGLAKYVFPIACLRLSLPLHVSPCRDLGGVNSAARQKAWPQNAACRGG